MGAYAGLERIGRKSMQDIALTLKRLSLTTAADNAIKTPVLAATTAALAANTATTTTLTANANGAIAAIDGVTLVLNDRVLIKNEVAQTSNGLYYVIQVGSASSPFILARVSDADINSEVKAGMLVVVTTGTVNADTIWELSANDPITIGTTNITFLKVSGAIDGSGTVNELTYWVDSDTVGALAVATYPSLTELSYVKGVTSAIQTQLNTKIDAIGDTITSATAGSVLFAGVAGILEQDNANFFWDNTNNRLGIGTTSPSATIHGKSAGTPTTATITALFENSASAANLKLYASGQIGAGDADGNLFIGSGSGLLNTGTGRNTSIGFQTLLTNGTGYQNTAMGWSSMEDNTTGYQNAAFGMEALSTNITGVQNTAIGALALNFNQSANNCTAVGYKSQFSNLTNDNTSFGYESFMNNTTGGQNTAIGEATLRSNVGGHYNVALGMYAGYSSTGSSNLYLGNRAGCNQVSVSNKLFIDNQDRGSAANDLTKSLIYGVFHANATSQELHFNSGIVDINGRLEGKQGADVASVAGAIALGYDGNTFEITGTNAITLISNLGWQNGSEITLIFTSTATLTNGTATSGTDITMLLAGAANFVASANDSITLTLCEIGGTQAWREKCRSVN